ncbi:hypothetical protein D3C72_2595750 [compost metagenome]
MLTVGSTLSCTVMVNTSAYTPPLPSLVCRRTLYGPGAIAAASLARRVVPLMLNCALAVSPVPLTSV